MIDLKVSREAPGRRLDKRNSSPRTLFVENTANSSVFTKLLTLFAIGLVVLVLWGAEKPDSNAATATSNELVGEAKPRTNQVQAESALDLRQQISPEFNASTAFHQLPSAAELAGSPYEEELLHIVAQIKMGDLRSALAEIEAHLKRFPKSRTGHLLRADTLTALAKGRLADSVFKPVEGEFDIDGLRWQLRNRWLHKSTEAAQATHELVPSALIDFGKAKHVLVADMQASRLYVYRNEGDRARLLSDYYMTVGSAGFGKRVEGDNKTPVGVYVVNQYIHPDTLPDLYGSGAFPVDYPNKLDRAKRRTGYGIWLHGTPSSTYARSPWASEGCFVLSNDDFEHIQNYISVDEQTPVVLADSVNWITQSQLNAARAEYLELIENWRQSWESLDTQRYLDFYAREQFNFGRGGFEAWAKRKAAVNQRKTFVQVQLDLEGVFEYPGEKDMFVAHFTQRYLSNNYASETRKQQYWQRDNSGEWRIVFEG